MASSYLNWRGGNMERKIKGHFSSSALFWRTTFSEHSQSRTFSECKSLKSLHVTFDRWRWPLTLCLHFSLSKFDYQPLNENGPPPSSCPTITIHSVLKYCKTSFSSDCVVAKRQTRQTDGREKKRWVAWGKTWRVKWWGRMDRAVCDGKQNGKTRERSFSLPLTQAHPNGNTFSLESLCDPIIFPSLSASSLRVSALFLLSAPIVLIKSVRLGVEGWWMECKRQREDRRIERERESEIHIVPRLTRFTSESAWREWYTKLGKRVNWKVRKTWNQDFQPNVDARVRIARVFLGSFLSELVSTVGLFVSHALSSDPLCH